MRVLALLFLTACTSADPHTNVTDTTGTGAGGTGGEAGTGGACVARWPAHVTCRIQDGFDYTCDGAEGRAFEYWIGDTSYTCNATQPAEVDCPAGSRCSVRWDRFKVTMFGTCVGSE